MIEKWLDENCAPRQLDGRIARINAQNFSMVIAEIERRTGIATGKGVDYCSKCNRDVLYPPLCPKCIDERVVRKELFTIDNSTKM